MDLLYEVFLNYEGTYKKLNAIDALLVLQSINRVLVWQIAEIMKAQRISKLEMARRMHTSRSQLDRFLDPDNDKVLLETVQRAASAIGKRVFISLEDTEPTPA